MKNALCTAAGVAGSFIASLFGGWDTGIATLVLFMAIDFFSGLAVAGIFKNSTKTETGALESKAGLRDCVANVKTSLGVNVALAPPQAEETMMLIGQDLKTGRIEMNEYGSNQQPVRVAGESYPVTTEVIPPQSKPFDPETGEIIEPAQSQKPINLRKAN